MHVFDASSMIYAWDNYPSTQFPPLWNWMANEIFEQRIVIPQMAFEEIKHKTPDCASWLKSNNLQIIEVSDDILQEAFRIKQLLEIKNDQYHPKGVDEKDIFIIATAKIKQTELVTNEALQLRPPDRMIKYRIPSVCNLTSVKVSSKNFLEFIKHSGVIFEGK